MDEFTERGRTLPHNEDAERAVLGAILLNANSLEVVADMKTTSLNELEHSDPPTPHVDWSYVCSSALYVTEVI